MVDSSTGNAVFWSSQSAEGNVSSEWCWRLLRLSVRQLWPPTSTPFQLAACGFGGFQGWCSQEDKWRAEKKKQKQTQSFSAAVVTFALFPRKLHYSPSEASWCCFLLLDWFVLHTAKITFHILTTVGCFFFLNRCRDNSVEEPWRFQKLMSVIWNFVSLSVNEKPRSGSEVRTPPSHFSSVWITSRPVKSLLSNTRLLFKSLKGSEDLRLLRGGKVCFCVSVFVPRLQFSCFHGSAQRDDHSCHTAATVILSVCVCVHVCVCVNLHAL